MADYHPFDEEHTPAGSQPALEPEASRPDLSRQRRSDYYEPTEGEGRAVSLLDYVKVLHKRRWTAATIFLLVFGGVTVYTFTATPIFEARTRLLIEADNQNVISFQTVLDGDQTRADYYQTQYNVLQSRALARRTLDELKLWSTPPFGGGADEDFSLKRTILSAPATLASTVGSLFASGETPPPAPDEATPGADETTKESRAIDVFASNLTIAPIRNSRLVDLKYRSPDAALATRVVNALARHYVEQSLEFKFTASKDASDWLGQRLGEERQQLEASETKLQQFREQNDAISLQDRENIVVQKLSDLNGAVTQARTERFQKEALYRQLESLSGNPEMLDTFPAILGNAFVQQQKTALAQLQSRHAQMGEKLGERHPDMVELRSAIQVSQVKIDAEIGKVVQSVKNDYLAVLAQENSLVAALNAQKGEALAMNRMAIDYSVIDREVQSSRQMYESLLQRAKETAVSTELKTSNISVVDRAERPIAPVSPQIPLNMLFALFGGVLAACGLAFSFEYLDSRLKSPDEIGTHLGLSQLGLLPALNAKALLAKYPLVSNGVPAGFAEAIRSVRTNVLFSSAQEGSLSLVVTSTGPGEGKSMVASNLAIALAQAGLRTLLIDADLRRPIAHEIFELSQDPGLSNLLVGNAKASDAVRKSGVASLWVLPSGRPPPNPAELLGSQRFKDFLESLKQHFDWVIIDSPPVMAVTDAALVAHYASGVVFVVGADMTSRHAAKTAVDRLRQVHAHFVGAVLNRVDLDRNSYYYSQYYRREYAGYYQQEPPHVAVHDTPTGT